MQTQTQILEADIQIHISHNLERISWYLHPIIHQHNMKYVITDENNERTEKGPCWIVETIYYNHAASSTIINNPFFQ